MKSHEVVERLKPWLDRVRRPAWKPIVQEGDGPVTASKFGGIPWIGPDAPWPDCRHCKHPLPLFLQLDLAALPEELDQQYGTGLLQLFYCTNEECEGDGGWEPFSDDVSRVRVIRPNGPGVAAASLNEDESVPAQHIVGWTPLEDLPSPEEHDTLGMKSSYDFDRGTLRLECPELSFDLTNRMSDCEVEEIALAEEGDKLAGWPAWVQGVEYPACPQCGAQMVLLFQVDSEDHIPFMFGDCGRGHITQCPEHKNVVAFGWACC